MITIAKFSDMNTNILRCIEYTCLKSTKHEEDYYDLANSGFGLWCITPLSTIFHLNLDLENIIIRFYQTSL